MKLIAKANLCGSFGKRDAGEEFVVDATAGADLIDRGLAEAS